MDYKCLMIDDDETIAENTAEYFNIFDIKTTYVTSYEQAVAFLAENTVSLLLLDINLGDKSGFELCRKIRSEFNMPILFISARTSDDDVIIALNIGGDDYIKKPFTLNVLLAKVKAILARYEKAKEAAELAAQSQTPEPPHRLTEAGCFSGTVCIWIPPCTSWRISSGTIISPMTRSLRWSIPSGCLSTFKSVRGISRVTLSTSCIAVTTPLHGLFDRL